MFRKLLSSNFATPSSSPSTPAQPAQSHPLEHEIKTTNNKIANLVDFLSDEVGISHKLHRTWEESILCAMCREPCIHPYLIQECKHMFCLACLQQWFAECLHKDLEHVDLPPHLEAQRDPPAKTLEEFYAAGVAYAGLSYTCPFCHARVWEKPKEEPALTCVISALTAVLGPAKLSLLHMTSDSANVLVRMMPTMHYHCQTDSKLNLGIDLNPLTVSNLTVKAILGKASAIMQSAAQGRCLWVLKVSKLLYSIAIGRAPGLWMVHGVKRKTVHSTEEHQCLMVQNYTVHWKRVHKHGSTI
ncbi:hypothetical protein EDC04DRAFT_2612169 [Pisolithus marmoratus]|nr:hypothetical protein EDC04DRAFT_2612169 [Pisolithus marmoratus]